MAALILGITVLIITYRTLCISDGQGFKVIRLSCRTFCSHDGLFLAVLRLTCSTHYSSSGLGLIVFRLTYRKPCRSDERVLKALILSSLTLCT